MSKRHYHVSRLLPAGTYYVGDPCYAFDSQPNWIGLLESANYTESPHILEADYEGRSFTAAHTAYGDGVYSDGVNQYPVDAGLIGAVPVAAADCTPFGMVTVTFDEDFTVSESDGVIRIGHIVVNTGDDDM